MKAKKKRKRNKKPPSKYSQEPVFNWERAAHYLGHWSAPSAVRPHNDRPLSRARRAVARPAWPGWRAARTVGPSTTISQSCHQYETKRESPPRRHRPQQLAWCDSLARRLQSKVGALGWRLAWRGKQRTGVERPRPLTTRTTGVCCWPGPRACLVFISAQRREKIKKTHRSSHRDDCVSCETRRLAPAATGFGSTRYDSIELRKRPSRNKNNDSSLVVAFRSEIVSSAERKRLMSVPQGGRDQNLIHFPRFNEAEKKQ